MTPSDAEEAAEQQAAIVQSLFPYVLSPLHDGQWLRGLLPGPGRSPTIRAVLGPGTPGTGGAPSRLFEFPVLTGTEGILVSPDEIWSALRGLAESTRPGQGETAVVMGMPLITADPTGPFARQPRAQDHAVNFLRFFTHFRREETSSLRGFLYRPADVLRLYFGSPDLTVTAIDISLNGPVETLLAAVPSLIRHEERLLVTSSAYDDPHCDRLMNAVTWGT